ncbi:class I SAM-dependent methyltransferase [Stenomitos frigidus]|uniref:Class I SAM-dependent methyltransferase n=1 Tax=Stenomitos frigidus ULC18 TaxID=2107698 RepID=A0A2T1DTF8_9CYAN|nr:class I SAM-dependent methyltransferase [Stenomitos frigidus]PSB23788.1 class I SAM-dependent methyltransferase [Stenomitos frigidus ULC18]
MIDSYSSIVELYQKSKHLPYRLLEQHTYLSVIGDVANKAVLDLGCGSGFYTRQFKQRGAAHVVGVDLAPKMIEAARTEEARAPLGLTYMVEDVAALGNVGDFDLVVSSYLLNCLPTQALLRKACQTIFANLKPGGRFVTVNDNVQQAPETYALCERYGCMKSLAHPLEPGTSLEEGTPILLSFSIEGQPFSFNNYYFSRTTYEAALQNAGFKSIQWHQPMLSPEAIQQFGRDFWNDFLEHSPITVIECSG